MVASAKQLGSAAFPSKDRLAASELDLQFTPLSTSWNLCIFLWLHDPNHPTSQNLSKIREESCLFGIKTLHFAVGIQPCVFLQRDEVLRFFAFPKFRATSVAASIPLHVVCLWKLTCLLFWKDNLFCTQLNCWSKTMVWEEIKESKMSNLLLLIINNKRCITNFQCTMIYLNILLASSCNILHCSRTAHPSRTAPLEPTCTGLCEIEVATSVLHLRWSGIPNRHTPHLMSGMPQAPFASRRSWSFKLIFGAKSWKEFLSTQKMQPKQCIVEIFKEAQWDTLLKMRFLAVSTSRRTAIIFNKKSNHWQKTQLRSQHQHLDIQGWEHWYPPKKKNIFLLAMFETFELHRKVNLCISHCHEIRVLHPSHGLSTKSCLRSTQPVLFHILKVVK